MPKIKIREIRTVSTIDEYADTSYLGEYTDNPQDEAIDRASGEFIGDIDRRHTLIESIQEKILYDDLSAERIEQMKERIAKIEKTGANEYPTHSREYRFFLPYAGGEKWQDGKNKNFRQYAMQDYNRMESLNNGRWVFLHIFAEAIITIGDSDILQTITSGGLSGIESDAEDWIAEVKKEEVSSLKAELLNLGATSEDFDVLTPIHIDR